MDVLDIILHIIFGLTLGYLFAKAIIPPNYYVGPNSTKIRNETHRDKDGCYRLKPVVHICPLNSKPISKAH